VAQSNPPVVDPVEDVTPAPIGDSACARRTSAARVNPAMIAVCLGEFLTSFKKGLILFSFSRYGMIVWVKAWIICPLMPLT
jgi:hypothetical protein